MAKRRLFSVSILLLRLVDVLGSHETTPWCTNGTDFIKFGQWKPNYDLHQNDWVLKPEAPCSLSTLDGVAALQALKGIKHILFVGDSMMRQVYHTLIHGVFRQMPVVVDAVYDNAIYKARASRSKTSTDETAATNYQVEDELRTFSKDVAIANLFKKLGNSGPGTTTTTDMYAPSSEFDEINISFIFDNTCLNVVEWVQKVLQPSVVADASQFENVVIVTNIGASNVKLTDEIAQCFTNDLPEILEQVLGHVRYSLVIMNHPIRNSRLRDRVSVEDFATLKEIVKETLNKLNTKKGEVVGHYLDFDGLTEESYGHDDAPPDATTPLMEDNLHYGCQWHPGGNTPNNENGRNPTEVRGMREIFQPMGKQLTQGKWVDSRNTNRDSTPAHCGLACDSKVYKALSHFLVSVIGTKPMGRPEKSRYEVNTCIPSYDRIPCPLYAKPLAYEVVDGKLSSKSSVLSSAKSSQDSMMHRKDNEKQAFREAASRRRLSFYQFKMACLKELKLKEEQNLSAQAKILANSKAKGGGGKRRLDLLSFIDIDRSINATNMSKEKHMPVQVSSKHRKLTAYQLRIACLKQQALDRSKGVKEEDLIQCQTKGVLDRDLESIKQLKDIGSDGMPSSQSSSQNMKKRGIDPLDPTTMEGMIESMNHHAVKRDCSQFELQVDDVAEVNRRMHMGTKLANQSKHNEAWEMPLSENIHTRKQQMERIAISNSYAREELTMMEELLEKGISGREVVGVYDQFQHEFDTAYHLSCKHSTFQRVRYTGSEWCEAALSGPGGKYSSESSSPSVTTRQGSSSSQPLGVWCSMPERGKFITF